VLQVSCSEPDGLEVPHIVKSISTDRGRQDGIQGGLSDMISGNSVFNDGLALPAIPVSALSSLDYCGDFD